MKIKIKPKMVQVEFAQAEIEKIAHLLAARIAGETFDSKADEFYDPAGVIRDWRAGRAAFVFRSIELGGKFDVKTYEEIAKDNDLEVKTLEKLLPFLPAPERD